MWSVGITLGGRGVMKLEGGNVGFCSDVNFGSPVRNKIV